MRVLVVVVACFLLITHPCIALETTNGRWIKTKWGITDAHWAKFEYIENGKIKGTPLYWYWDTKNFTIDVSPINFADDYSEINVTYKVFVREAKAHVEIFRNVKEYRYKPFTEVTVSAKSDKALVAMYPNFPSYAKGDFILAPDVAESKSTKIGDKTDGRWPLIVNYNTKDNYALIYTPNETTTLVITNKSFAMTSWDKGDHWKWYFMMWKFSDVQPNKIYTYKYWLTPINISENDIMETIKAKASDLAHEALVKAVKIYENKTRGYDYWLYEVWYKFDYEPNDWNINPFKLSPHDSEGRLVNDTCLAAIYLPENAIAVNGPEGYPAVFSDGRPAIGLYFRDSINGPRGNDLWFGNESCGGGFYLKKFDPTKDIIKVYYIVPAEPLIESYPVKVKGLNVTERTRLIVVNESYFAFLNQIFILAVIFLIAILAIAIHSFTKNKILLASIILVFLPLLYLTYGFYLNPLRFQNFYLAILLYSIISTLIYMQRVEGQRKFYASTLIVSIAAMTSVVLMFFNPYLIPPILISVALVLVEGWKGLKVKHNMTEK